ncbi:MAG: exonuclease [Oscillospiraceae bacterium]|nr:exonuclease [Oscillospiraceae bacterium]
MPYFYTLNDDGTLTLSHEKPEKVSRPSRGKSLLKFVDDYTVIDLETTGLSPQYDEIIEFAAIRVRGGIVSETMQFLIKPEYEIDGFITELTGITNEMLADAPNIKEVLPAIKDFIGDDVLVGHNVSFDVNFLYDNFSKEADYLFRNDYIDTVRISRILLPKLPHHRLKDITKALGVGARNMHRALSDCEVTRACFESLRSKTDDIAEFNKRYHSNKLDMRDITATTSEFNEGNPFNKKKVVFTGTLDRFTRVQAAQIVVNLGGICENNLTKETDYLVLGNNDYNKSVKDGKSSKMKKAEAYRLKGCEIEVIPEQVFYDMIEDN